MGKFLEQRAAKRRIKKLMANEEVADCIKNLEDGKEVFVPRRIRNDVDEILYLKGWRKVCVKNADWLKKTP